MSDDLCACGWSAEEHDFAEHSPEIRCGCQAHQLEMPDMCDNDPRNWDVDYCEHHVPDYATCVRCVEQWIADNRSRWLDVPECPNGSRPGPLSCPVPRCPCCKRGQA